MPIVSAHDVARELRRRQPQMGRAKLQKLLYLSQGFMLGWTGEPLFDEGVEAWPLGPVVANLWKDEEHLRPAPSPRELTGRQISVIDVVMSHFGQMTGEELIRLTHTDGGPWCQVTEDDRDDAGPRSVPIPTQMIQSWFATHPVIASQRAEADRLATRRVELWDADTSPGLATAVGRVLDGEQFIDARR